jgi:protein-S-isoprenylcysteine O-methyltransferase Ste14
MLALSVTERCVMLRFSWEVAPQMPDHPQVIAPPPLIFAAFLVLGLVAHRYLPLHANLPPVISYALGASLVFAGAAVILAALGLFRYARTRPEPWQPTTAIVTHGIYGHTRNPMYVGMALTFAGVAILCDSVLALLLLVPALREEHYLSDKFGADYQLYTRCVRRWL